MTESVALPGGPTLAYREWGRPDGAVVLLLHGLTSSGADWRHFAPLVGERFRVVAPDLRGHGESSWPGEYSLELMRNDVVRLLDALGFYGVIPFGHSAGALVAFLLAATRPDLVRALVLEEMPTPDPADPPLEVPRRPGRGQTYDWRAASEIQRWRNSPPSGWWPMTERISCPTLIVGGTNSHLRQDRLAELARRIPNARYVSMNGGHDLHARRPGEFDTVIEPFLTPWAR
ncbi:MAG TPA: alpha/beta fold hydrolase [Propionibacteriaceae bacterium]|nr:alpha/beta fold hydrolase [Propionibacteriaceae bacterium]